MRYLSVFFIFSVFSFGAALREVRIAPQVAYIYGSGATHHLLFTAVYDDGTERDVTEQAAVTFDSPDVVETASPGQIKALKEGIAKLRVEFDGWHGESVVIVHPKRMANIDFIHEVAPIFSRMGCNNTNCHGSLNGQKGFKLSLFGYDPEADYHAVVEASGGRRINRGDPENSLILLKPTFSVPHGGGHILKKDPSSYEYAMLLNWVRAGTPRSAPNTPRLVGMDVYPSDFSVLKASGGRQHIVVVGHYSDGSQEDITRRVRYTSSNEEAAAVNLEGEVEAKANGQTTIVVRTLGLVAALQVGVTLNPPVPETTLQPANFIDQLVFQKLAQMNIEVSSEATDPEFLRRVYLDVIGLVPPPDEARRFLGDPSPDKRAKLIDRLLESREFADFWGMKWAELMASNVFTVNDGTAYLQDWMRDAFAANKPYDQFVREILTAKGSTWDNGAANFFSRPAEDLTTLSATAFLGISIECARCHDHPFGIWKRDDFIGMTAFFAQMRGKGRRPPPVEAIHYVSFDQEYRHPDTKQVVRPRFLNGTEPAIRPMEDRRKVLADWMTSPENPWFARATVNRFWRQLMGKGLVEPVDDFRPTNPPADPALLNALARDFVEHHYDVRYLLRTILNSKTYQLSSIPKPANRDDEIDYSRYYMRRLTAEQMLDSVVEITGVPEKFLAYYPGVRAVNLADGGVPSSFLDMYDRPKRDAAKCERNENVSLRQAMNMMAGDTVNQKIRSDRGNLAKMIAEGRTDDQITEHFYLASLSRYPTPREKDVCRTAIGKASSRRAGLENVVWALLDSNEFLYNH
jgi:hypothetical protein